MPHLAQITTKVAPAFEGKTSWFLYEEQKDEWRKRDPIVIHEEYLISHEIASREECDAISSETEKMVEDAVDFARNSPFPEPEEL